MAPDAGAGGVERVEAFFAGHAFDPHRHDTYALGVTLAGVQRFGYRGAVSDSLHGDLIVLHPDEVHDGRAGAEGGFRYRMAYVEPRVLRAALGERARALPFVRQAVQADERLRSALVRLLSDLDRPLEPVEADGALAGLADALLALDRSAAGRTTRVRADAAAERAREFLDANLHRTVASAELEAAAGLDRFETARAFRRRFGTSPHRYLTMRRLGRARALIRSGETLAEAAAECGFADQSHMTRQFRAAFGMPPGRWRSMQALGPAREVPDPVRR
jgi:AraC-like DNA-binding protein